MSSVEPIIYWLFVVSLLLLLIKLFLLDPIPAPSVAFFKLGYIAETTLRSLLAGTVFYVSVTATKIYADRKRLAPWLVGRLTMIVSRHERLTSDLSASAQVSEPDDDPVAAAFASLLSTDVSPVSLDLIGQRATWRSYLKSFAEGIKDLCGQVGRRGNLMETEILGVVTEIEHSHFLNMIMTLPDSLGLPFRLQSFYTEFLTYNDLMKDLAAHHDRLIRQYGLSSGDKDNLIPLQIETDSAVQEPDPPLPNHP